MLEIQGLYAGYGGENVLKNVDIFLAAGEITAILGPNGSGKSTLLKTICGIVPASAGQIRLDGQDLLSLPPKQLARQVSYLTQNRQVPQITAEQLVLHGRFPYLGYPRRYRQEDHAAARRAMETMGITDLAQTPLEQLSGGQRQKVYIAMVLAQDTQVVLLDEPTTFLDVGHQLQTLDHARHLAAAGKTVVMVVHDITQALRVAGQVILLSDGTVAGQGTPEELFRAGTLDRVFGVTLCRTKTENGWLYYCADRQK